MTLTEFLGRYGYLAVLIGTFVEGETILVMAGFAAHQGYLSLPLVILAAFGGSLAGDQLAFFVGRRYATRLLSRFPRLAPGVRRADRLLARYGTPLLLGFRFVYGIRNVTPLAAGSSRIASFRFLALNVVGAAAWAVCIAYAGYAFGHGFELLLDRAKAYEAHAFLVFAAVGTAAAIVWWLTRRSRGAAG
jgi:membrane protein DedA with SNARE-associated domain